MVVLKAARKWLSKSSLGLVGGGGPANLEPMILAQAVLSASCSVRRSTGFTTHAFRPAAKPASRCVCSASAVKPMIGALLRARNVRTSS